MGWCIRCRKLQVSRNEEAFSTIAFFECAIRSEYGPEYLKISKDRIVFMDNMADIFIAGESAKWVSVQNTL